MASLVCTTIHQELNNRIIETPDKDCVVYPYQDIRWSYKEFGEICKDIAKGLLAFGIKKGDHVSIWATNYPQWLIVQFATAMIGAVLVTVNTAYKSYELEYLLKQSDSSTLIMINGIKGVDYSKIIYDLIPELADSEPGKLSSAKFPKLKNVININNTNNKGMLNFDELTQIGKVVPDDDFEAAVSTLDPHDVINMQYTSGTTGFPKGVMLTHYNIINNGFAIGESMKLTSDDRLCIPVPLFHCFGCVLGVMACLTHGSTMVLVDHFNPVKVMQAVEKEKCTALHGVPTMFISILGNEQMKETDFSSLRTGIMAGSPCPIEVMKKCVEHMNMTEITIAYGQTEASPVITQTTTDDSIELRVSTVGRVLPGMECKIVDPKTGRNLPPNTQGEIVVKGYNVMKGYYNMPEATALVIDSEGWLHTGDLGVIDENGYYKITGRIKDMIIRGGENIYPKEVEEFLYTIKAIDDVQVIGVPNEKYGEEVMACIIKKSGVDISTQEIIEYTKAKLSKYKIPKYIWFVNSFPMTASGKIQKFKLRQLAIEHWQLQDAASIVTA